MNVEDQNDDNSDLSIPSENNDIVVDERVVDEGKSNSIR